MSSEVMSVVTVTSLGFATVAIVTAARALKQSKTLEVFERQPQPYMLQVDPPSQKVQALGLPRRESDMQVPRERQA
jgi:hypothetical protein